MMILGQADPQSRPPVDLVLTDATKPLDLGQVPLFHPAHGHPNLGGGRGFQRVEPLPKGTAPIGTGQQFLDLVAHDRDSNVNVPIVQSATPERADQPLTEREGSLCPLPLWGSAGVGARSVGRDQPVTAPTKKNPPGSLAGFCLDALSASCRQVPVTNSIVTVPAALPLIVS